MKTFQKLTLLSAILLMPDAADSAGAAAEVDPLSQAAGGIEAPKFPCLAGSRICRFTIKSILKAATKDDATRESLTIAFKTTKDYPDTDGKTLGEGFTVYKRIGITPVAPEGEKRGRTMKDIAADIAMLLKAVGKKDATPRQLLDNPSMLDGEIIDLKTGVQPAKNGFPESNTLAWVLPA